MARADLTSGAPRVLVRPRPGSVQVRRRSSPSGFGNSKMAGGELHVFVVDWDGTVLPQVEQLPTEAGARAPCAKRRAENEAALRALVAHEQAVCRWLQLLLSCGQVVILTNSEDGWVLSSAREHLPRVVPLLDRVAIVSARSLYEPVLPGQPQLWKWEAMREVVLPSVARYVGARTPTEALRRVHVYGFGDMDTDRALMERLFAASRHASSSSSSPATARALDLGGSGRRSGGGGGGIRPGRVLSVLFLPESSIEQLTHQVQHTAALLSELLAATQSPATARPQHLLPFHDWHFVSGPTTTHPPRLVLRSLPAPA